MRTPAQLAWYSAVVYVLVAEAWILLSDHLVFLIGYGDSEAVQILKGTGFVLVTGTVVLFLANRMYGRLAQAALDQQRAEGALHAGEEKYRLLFESSMDAILLTGEDGAVFAANPAACAMLRRTGEEICRLGRAGVVDPTDPRLPALLETRRQTGAARGELTLVRSDGSKFPVEVSSAVFTDRNGATQTSVIIRDITERQRAEQGARMQILRLGLLVDLARSIATSLDLETILQRTVRKLDKIFPALDLAILYLWDPREQVLVPKAWLGYEDQAVAQIRLEPGESISGKVFQHSQAVLTRNQAEAAALRGGLRPENAALFATALKGRQIESNICAPLRGHTGETLGTLTIGSTRGVFTEEDLALLEGMAGQLAQAIGNARLLARTHQLSHHLVQVAEEERRLLSRELHDETGQALTALKINLESLHHSPNPERVEECLAITNELLQQVRDISLDLRPSLLDDFGLVAALRRYMERRTQQAGLELECSLGTLASRAPVSIETACFRIAQQALTNTIRHARATRVRVELSLHAGVLRLVVADDGAGFDVPAALERAANGESVGLLGMQERARLAGGEVEFRSEPGKGTTVLATFALAGRS